MYCQPNVRPEAFGISLVEALAAGLPVVTSDIGGACEIVDNSCGVLTPPGDVDALAAALRRVASDAGLRARLGAAAAVRPEALCNVPRQMRRIEQVLSSVIVQEPAAQI
jgi:glycosyltransferase involved in cell wall biosynthesis